jgi:hypothetical protein
VAALAIVVEIVAVRARRQRAFDALRMAAQSARPRASTLRPRSAP